MVHLWPIGRPYSLFYGLQAGLMASLEHHLQGSPEDTLGRIFLYISFMFYGSIEVIMETIHR
jgi:hypothetical protein